MNEKVPEDLTKPPPKSHTQFIVALIVAAAVYMFFEMVLNKMIETPLRQISSTLGQFLLSFFYSDVIRNGTILVVSGFRFDVVGACSGSTTLKVLTGLGIFWVGTYPRLTVERRIFAGLLTIPIAIVSNGLRVAMLVAGSVTLGEPIEEGFVHTLFGLISFSLALGCLFILTDRLALHKSKEIKAVGVRKKWIALAALMFLLYLPFLSKWVQEWIGARWNTYNHTGFLFCALGITLGLITWFRSPMRFNHQKLGLTLFFLALLTALASIMIDLRYLLGISLIEMVLAFCLLFKGIRFAVVCLPLIGITFLSFPKITVVTGKIASNLGFSGWKYDMPIRAAIGVVLLIIFIFIKRIISKERPERKPVFGHLTMILVSTIVVVCFQAYFATAPMSERQNNTLKMSFIIGDWVGRDIKLDPHSLNYFGYGNIWQRHYTKGDDYVDLIINSSGGDRSRNHPPEYCQTGAGYKFEKSEVRTYRLPNNEELSVTHIAMHKDDQKLTFLYWFSDGKTTYADYVGMMARDTARRLIGKKTDWFLFRAMSPNPEAIEDFMSSFSMEIVPVEKASYK